MTPDTLYAMTPEKVDNAVEHLGGYRYNHVPEVGEDFALFMHQIETSEIEIRYLKDWCFDGRRVWILATVWFKGKPVMITRNAGREGDDHSSRFITDSEGYLAMCQHIKELMAAHIEPEYLEDVVSADEDIPFLTEFYGNKLEGYFERY